MFPDEEMIMRKVQWLLIAGLLLALAAPVFCLAQATGSAISGVVRDPSQAVVAGVTVAVTNVETGTTRTVQSDEQGRYRVGELQPGSYQVAVTMTGFSKETRRGITL